MQSLPFIAWCLENLNQYWVIILLMAIESSFIPFPSEIVIIPASYMAYATMCGQVAGSMPPSELNIFLIVLFGTVGAIMGAMLNYGLSVWLGRPIIYKFANSRIGHMCMLNEEKIKTAEEYFDKHGAMGTFFGRLVPAVRQLISIPAGLARMNLAKFIAFTALGSGLWNGILAAIGCYLATIVSWDMLDAKIAEYSVPLKWTMIGVGLLVVAYLIWQALRDNKKKV